MKRLLCLPLLLAGTIAAQRPKPVYDPETKDGLLIQHIQQEQDPAEKLNYLEQFASQFASHPAIAWVYDQLQPAYFRMKEYDQTVRIGVLRLAIEPENLEAARLALRSADARHEDEELLKWADRVWQIASKLAAGGGPKAVDARESQVYAESCIYSAAQRTTDLKARLALLQKLEERNPASQYVAHLPDEYLNIYRQLGNTEKVLAVAEKAIQSDPDNANMLLVVADHHFRKDDAREKVIAYTTRVTEILRKKPRPDAMGEEEWAKKKSQMLGIANYMGGISSSLLSSYARADTMLRAALPNIHDNDAIEATALYHLALANYRLAEKGEHNRAGDALKFMRRCAAMKSGYQAQAIKNVEAIRTEYSLP